MHDALRHIRQGNTIINGEGFAFADGCPDGLGNKFLIFRIDLPLMVEEVVELLAEGTQAKGLEFICAVAPEVPPMVKGDHNRLRQILMNLLSNAIKFTP